MRLYWNTVFIHIPRTSGTSLKWALNNKISDLEYLRAQYHKTAKERKIIMGEKQWDRHYKFTIVRNPWERAVSWWSLRRDTIPFEEWLFETNVGQSQYFTENSIILVDDVFQYETLDDHLEDLCRKAQWPSIKRISNVNATTHDHYTSYYNDQTIEYVANQCAFEIDAFGYKF